MKRTISLMLAMIMVLSMLPMSIFAAGTPTISVSSATVEANGTVVVEVSISNNTGFTNFDLQVACDENLTLTKISQGALLQAYHTEYEDLTWTQNVSTKKFSCVAPSATITGDGVIAKLTFTAGSQSGDNTVSIVANETASAAMKNNGSVVDLAYNAGTITVTGGEGGEGGTTTPTGDYQVTMSTSASTVSAGNSFDLIVSANKGFAAAEITVKVESMLDGVDIEPTITSGNCTVNLVNINPGYGIKLVAYGLDESSPATFVLTFGTTNKQNANTMIQYFETVEAAFGTGVSAETANLTKVSNVATAAVDIMPAAYNVTLPDTFTGNATVSYGADYTFAPETATGAYYNYDKPTVTVDGEAVEVIENADGSWTVKNVTGELVITGNRTPKNYGITINGEGTDVSEKVSYTGTPTYKTDFTFTIPADKAAGLEAGYTYALTSVTIGGSSYSFSTDGKSCTIPGSAITGDVVITVTKTVLEVNKFTVTADGSGNGDATITNATVGKNENAVMTLTTDPLYTYDVEATMAGQNVNVDISDNTYTVANVTGNVIFTVTKTLNVTSAKVDKYVQLDGSRMWLVTINGNGTTQVSGKTYTYNGKQMSWSEKYQAYAVLVVAANQDGEADKPDVTTGFGLVTVDTIPAITYNMDVNMADDQNTVDAADAQLVWNMYSTKYSDFTAAVTMEKFFRADVNGDKKVDTNDALAIVNSILGINQ